MESQMTNDNPKCPDCDKDKDHHDHILYCKPVEPPCEQCGGDGETWDGKEPRVRLCKKCYGTGIKPDTDKEYINLYPKKKEWEFTTVKPVEPSVEAFDAGLIQEIYDYCDYRRKVSGVARGIIELIKKRKNERNRK